MLIGHYGVAFGAKAATPRSSLGTLIAAAALLDLMWPLLVVLGVETVTITPGATAVTPLTFNSYPWSHSLLMALIWAGLFGGGYYALTRQGRGAAVVAGLVVSHWVLDAITHIPDLPLWPGGPKLGLGLWNSLPGTLVVEGGLFAVGLFLYARTTTAKDGIGRWGLAGLVAFLLAIYAGAVFGPPPPHVGAIAWADNAQWLLILWAWWVDRHRRA